MGDKNSSKEWIIKILLAVCIFLGGFAISQMTVVAKVQMNTSSVEHNKEMIVKVETNVEQLAGLMTEIIGQNNILINQLSIRK